MKKVKRFYLFIFFLFIAILPYCYLSFFANPSADDFSFSVQSRQNDFFHLLYQTYFFWNGRYISNIFIFLNPISFGSFVGYKIIPIIIIVLFMVANFLFIKEVFVFISKTKQLIITLLLSLLFIHNMPIIAEGIYWFTGAVIYQLGIISTLIYLSFLIHFIRKKEKWYTFIILTVLLFIVCGFNEVLSLLIIFFLAVATFIFYSKQFLGKKQIGLQFLLALIFVSFMIFSPGNEYRGEAYQNAHNFTKAFVYSILQTGRFSLTWIASIPLICASILYYHFNKKWSSITILFQHSFYLNRWFSLAMLFIIIFICVFPAYWATGILGQHRTLNVAYFFFLIMWFINLSVWFNSFKRTKKIVLSKALIGKFSLLFLIGILFTNNGYYALYDVFSGTAKEYNHHLEKRHKKLFLATQKNPKELKLSALNAKPNSLFIIDITSDPNYWINRGYNDYFNLSETKIYIQHPKID